MATQKTDILTDPLVKYIIGPVLTIMFGAVSLYAGWVTSTINTHTSNITDLKVKDAHFDGDLQVINDKIQLLLDMNNLNYSGPKFHQHNQDKN